MPTTAKGLRYPASSAAPNVPQDIQNLASDVDTRIGTTWTEDLRSASAFTVTATSFPSVLFGPYSVVIPSGRQLEVEFSAPLIDTPANTGLQGRILMGATVEDGKYWSNSGTTSIGHAGWMKGVQTGTGASVSFSIQAARQGAGGGSVVVSAASIGFIIVRHRIV